MQTWHEAIGDEKQKAYFTGVVKRVHDARQHGETIYPPAADVFNAFKYTEFDKVKVVILGQDPYHGPGQAHGLAFSVRKNMAIPPSLLNIYKELQNDIPSFVMPQHGFLLDWAKQGVFLLNNVLTVQAGNAHSHAAWGWEQFTDVVVHCLNDNKSGLVFLLWGSHAQKKGAFIDRERHLVLSSPHPSPLSAHRGFFGCKHFSKTNQYLLSHAQSPIDWQIR